MSNDPTLPGFGAWVAGVVYLLACVLGVAYLLMELFGAF